MFFVCFQQIATVATVTIDDRGRLVSVTGTVTRIRGGLFGRWGPVWGPPPRLAKHTPYGFPEQMADRTPGMADELGSTGVGTGGAYGSISGDGASRARSPDVV